MASGLSLRAALRQWPHEMCDPGRSHLRAAARRLVLGDSFAGALEAAGAVIGEDAAALAMLLEHHARFGGNAVAGLRRLASAVDRRHDAQEAARAAVAGVRLSGRIVAGLPLVLAASSVAHDGIPDPVTLGASAAGAVLAVCGLVWMERLVPRPPEHDPAAIAADHLAALLDSGAPLAAARAAVAGRRGSELAGLDRKLRLGAPWADVVADRRDDPLEAVTTAVRRAARAGTPAVEALEALAESRRREQASRFEGELRRAPVRMVVPLTLVVLPAFVLMGVAPLVRAL